MDNKETEVVQTEQQRAGWAAYPVSTKVLMGALLAMVVVIAGGAVWYVKTHHKAAIPVGNTNVPLVNDNEQSAAPSSAIEKDNIFPVPALSFDQQNQKPNPNTTVLWETPKPQDNLGVVLGYSNGDGTMQSQGQGVDAKYFEIGHHNGNAIVLAQISGNGPYNENVFFEKTPQGFILMSLMSAQDLYDGKDSGGYVLSTLVVSADQKTYYRGLIGPEILNWNGFALNQPYITPIDLWSNWLKVFPDAKVTKVADLPQGALYMQESVSSVDIEGQNNQKFYLRRYILVSPSGFYTNYNIKYDFLSDNGVPKITWADGTKNSDPYRVDASVGGCGSPGAYITPVTDISNALKVTGTSSTGVTIYEFADSGNRILHYFYDKINGEVYNADQQKSVPISFDEWNKHHPVIAVKNPLGIYMLMTNSTYGEQAECGKPVVYLYPTKTTKVSVKVGADIDKSEPAYNNGWNVVANPNGMLTNADSKTYDSLFWEGLGHGDYPAISEGFIVKHSDLEGALRNELKEQGLNDKESNDFMDFWLAKMPNTPYVRLTWFTTEQLNLLAPLSVSPHPDTVIRVFLDFQGLQQPIVLPQQHLSSIPRQGFTLVEWGGLLRH